MAYLITILVEMAKENSRKNPDNNLSDFNSNLFNVINFEAVRGAKFTTTNSQMKEGN